MQPITALTSHDFAQVYGLLLLQMMAHASSGDSKHPGVLNPQPMTVDAASSFLINLETGNPGVEHNNEVMGLPVNASTANPFVVELRVHSPGGGGPVSVKAGSLRTGDRECLRPSKLVGSQLSGTDSTKRD